MAIRPADDSLDALRERSQGLLVDFLRVDLELAFTMFRTAQIEQGDSQEHYQLAIGKVRDALSMIRSLTRLIENPIRAREIHIGANELHEALKASSN